MKVLILLDSFKGSLSSARAAAAAAEGIRRVLPNAELRTGAIADGGEGTMEALSAPQERISLSVTGPLGEKASAAYAILHRSPDTAILDVASAAGLTMVPSEKRDVLRATSYGVGEMIADALRRGCRRFLVGLGGSATNDGGAGMLHALGFSLTDAAGKEIPTGALGLASLAAISDANVSPALRASTFTVMCDVGNPLLGERGCSSVFAPQKGARPEDIPVLEAAMANFAAVTRCYAPTSDSTLPGSGAAGGLGFAFRSFLSAALKPGIEVLLAELGLEEEIRAADIILCGEGRMDAQTAMGKAPAGIARAAKRYGKPVIAFCGSVGDRIDALHGMGIDAFFPILRAPCTLEQAMAPEIAAHNLAAATEQVFRLLALQVQ